MKTGMPHQQKISTLFQLRKSQVSMQLENILDMYSCLVGTLATTYEQT